MPNRIVTRATKLARRLEQITPDARARLQKTVQLDPVELAAWQREKSLAQLEHLITVEEAQTIYAALSNWKRATLSVQIAVTQVVGELLESRIKEWRGDRKGAKA
jgi:23S rRNA pseudoU1915 N3-methylase RlmH